MLVADSEVGCDAVSRIVLLTQEEAKGLRRSYLQESQ